MNAKTRTFTLTDGQYRTLMSALVHAIDVYQEARMVHTEKEVEAVQAELRKQADAQFEARR